MKKSDQAKMIEAEDLKTRVGELLQENSHFATTQAKPSAHQMIRKILSEKAEKAEKAQ